MPMRLDARSPSFQHDFANLLAMKREVSEDVDLAAKAIIDDVVARGDAALVDYTRRFDRLELAAADLAITPAQVDEAIERCDADAIAALRLAHDRIEAYHRRQKPGDERFTDALGVELGHRWTAVEAAGLYVPGGTASYPSSVLMNAVPAKVAGVPRIVMVVPSPDGVLNPLVLAAARIAGVTEIYRVGGAQAIAALAYGTATIAPVAKIVGPGNAYVAAAKRRVFGQVGIDMIAGPSEVVVIADATATPTGSPRTCWPRPSTTPPRSPFSSPTVPTWARPWRRRSSAARDAAARRNRRGKLAGFGAILIVPDLDACVPLVDRLAPEHLEIETEDAEGLAAKIRNAGSIFLGRHTPEAIGDYVGGPNHVLPTARSARFSSGLGVLDFMKRTSILKCGPEALRALGPAAITLGRAEGLEAHARSVAIRLNLG